jgi:hypothetical protein
VYDSPGELRGYVGAVVAVLRVDPTTSSLAFSVVAEGEDEYTAVFAGGRGFLRYRVPAGSHVVVLLPWCGPANEATSGASQPARQGGGGGGG